MAVPGCARARPVPFPDAADDEQEDEKDGKRGDDNGADDGVVGQRVVGHYNEAEETGKSIQIIQKQCKASACLNSTKLDNRAIKRN